MAEQYKIVGITKTPAKDKKDVFYFAYHMTKSFSAYDVENRECQGVAVCIENSSKDLGVSIGDVVVPNYTKGWQDKAVLTGFTILKAASPQQK